MRAAIAGTGLAVPEGRLTNADLEARVDTSDEWIVERTGIRERRIAKNGETTCDLSIAAGAAALKQAGMTPDDIDLLVVATTTPDRHCPATSAMVHDGLGIRGGAFDLNAACAGFVYSLGMVGSMIETGRVGNVLVVGAEIISRFIDVTDRSTSILFGDGAGAAVITGTEADRGLLGWDAGCDGSAVEILTVPMGEQWLKMDGAEVFRRAVRVVVESANAALERSGLGPEDVALFVPHQANARIITAACTRLGIPAERTMVNVDRYGNTSAASIPIALAEAVDQGRMADGDVVLLSGFGAGMTWASAVLRWGR